MFYDKKSTLSAWPLLINDINELNNSYKELLLSKIPSIHNYKIIYNPKEDYVAGYGNHIIFYIDNTMNYSFIDINDIKEIETFKELLEGSISIKTHTHTITLKYNTTTYYIYDPLLDYLCNCENISFNTLEKTYPRPKGLYVQSLCMYNYCTYAYRLGTSILKYEYRYRNKREKWMPWKIHKEEWLSVDNDRGIFNCYSYKYVIKCIYKFKR